METRIEYARAAPGAVRAMYAIESYVAESDLEASLLELVKLRASQINGCAYCVDMHARDARVMGESEPRLYTLSVWRETPFYTDRERAALAWTEAVTEVGRQGVGDEVYRQARAHFPERELVDLTLAIIPSMGGTGSPSASARRSGATPRARTKHSRPERKREKAPACSAESPKADRALRIAHRIHRRTPGCDLHHIVR